MSTPRGKSNDIMSRPGLIKALSSYKTWLLLVILVIALVEKGPPSLLVYTGASPFNTGFIGTHDLALLLRERYPNTFALNSYDQLNVLLRNAERCVFVCISPEQAYSVDEAKELINELRICKKPALLIADEKDTSNTLLEELGSAIRVTSDVIYKETNGSLSPYVTAVFNIPRNNSYILTLDIASRLSFNSSKVNTLGVTEMGDIVSVYESEGGFDILVISDGSLFLNQVFRSNLTSYRDFTISVFDFLCENHGDCRILIDGTRYPGILVDPVDILANNTLLLYVDYNALVILLISRLLHPLTWFPLLLNTTNSLMITIHETPQFLMSLVIFLTLMLYRYLTGRKVFVKDSKVAEQIEYEAYATRGIREAILRGSIKLTKQDFISLYSLVDAAVRSLHGCGLCDPRLLNIIGWSEDNKKYVYKMCSLYERASKRKFFPIVVSWNRTTKKMIKETERFLMKLGHGVIAEKGLELVFTR